MIMRTSLFKKTQIDARSSRVLPALLLSMGLAVALPSISYANNPAPAVRADAPNVYVVKKGDTLWHISKRYLKDAWRWPELWAANPQVKNPHLIYPGDRLLLCSIGGRSVVGIDAGDGCDGIIRRMGETPAGEGKLSPRVRVEPLDVAVPAIPLSEIRGWLTNARVVDYKTLKEAPYVLSAKDKRVITSIGDVIYVRGGNLQVGDRFGVYREGERYADPETNETLGYEARQVAAGLVIDRNEDITSIRLTDSYQQEVRDGDRILPEENANLPVIFYPTSAKAIENGRLIRVMDSIDTAAARSVVAINRGTREGLQAGQVVAVYRRGSVVVDPKMKDKVRLPSEKAGLAMIFRSFDKMSYAYVLEADVPIKVGDEIRPPISAD
jgi:hypothetical protein